MKDIILYHGSKSGIVGDIRPSSRENCDFGRGFYMGESAANAKAFVADKTAPVIYTVKFRLSEISENKILRLSDADWLYTVLACRKMSRQFNQLPIAKEAIARIQGYDVVVGKIADDKMVAAMDRFNDNALTDKGLMYCLQHVQYGNQYVAVTPEACSKIEILAERPLFGKEKEQARMLGNAKRAEGDKIITKAVELFLRDGQFLTEIIKSEQQKETGPHKKAAEWPAEEEKDDYGRE